MNSIATNPSSFNFIGANNLNLLNKNNQNIPISVPAYPEQAKNVHVNMNITNININSKNPTLNKKIPKQIFKCDREEKLIKDITDSLLRRGINYESLNRQVDYTLKFDLSKYGGKAYEITIERDSSKIIDYKKSKDNRLIVFLSNTEGKILNLLI